MSQRPFTVSTSRLVPDKLRSRKRRIKVTYHGGGREFRSPDVSLFYDVHFVYCIVSFTCYLYSVTINPVHNDNNPDSVINE